MKGMHLEIDCAAPSAGDYATGGCATRGCVTGGCAALAPVCIVDAPSGLIMNVTRCNMSAIVAGIQDDAVIASAVGGASALKGRLLYRRGQAKRRPRILETQFQALKGRQMAFAAA